MSAEGINGVRAPGGDMRRFMLAKQRSQPGSRSIALVIAVLVTAALGLLPAVQVPAVRGLFSGSVEPPGIVAFEQLRYVDLAVADDSRVAVRAPSAPPRPRVAPAGLVPSMTVVVPSATADAGDKVSPVPPSDPHPYGSFTPGPPVLYTPRGAVRPRLGRFPGTATFNGEQQDSLLWKFERTVPYAPRVKATLAERDAMLRDEARRWAVAQDQKRPVPVSAVWGEFLPETRRGATPAQRPNVPLSGGFSLPLFSPGPSAGDRRRDSGIHAGNLQRLARLADRAKARQDSLRRMDSIAMLTRSRPPVP